MSDQKLKRSLDATASAGAAEQHPVLEPGHTYGTVTDQISAIVLTQRVSRGWILGFAFTFCLVMLFLSCVGYLLARGIGVWGNNIPVAWAFDIINFVWWIGIGHAGTLISAILLLLGQRRGTSYTRLWRR